MSSMMNGWHYDRAKDGNNEYAVRIAGQKVIMHATYASAFDVYRYAKETMLASEQTYEVALIKEYDSKVKKYVEEVIRV